LNFFEPPEATRSVFTPASVLQRIGFDVALGVALGVGAACAVFAYNWAGFGTDDGMALEWVFWAILTFAVVDSFSAGVLGWIEKRWSGAPIVAVAWRWIRAGTYVVVLGGAALLVGQRLARAVDRDFLTLVAIAVVLGAVWLLALRAAWREARPRVTPWVVAAVSLYLGADWAVKLGPAVGDYMDPRLNIAFYTLIGCGVYGACAVLALMDHMIRARDRAAAIEEPL
jgi:hypothetical protein